MAFGIPGSAPSGENGQFLGRIQFDARTGFWTVVKRKQGADGMWTDQQSDPMRTPQFLMDFGSLEVGYIKFASPPAFVLAPYGQPVPQQPEELIQDAAGKKKKAFQPAFRVKLASQKTFGDGDIYYFAQNSKTVLDVMDELYQRFETSPEAGTGQIPVVSVTGTRVVEFKTQQGTTKFHAPVFEITAWFERIPAFGDRTVPAPIPHAAQPAAAPVAAQPATPAPWGAPTPATTSPIVAPPARAVIPVDEMPF